MDARKVSFPASSPIGLGLTGFSNAPPVQKVDSLSIKCASNLQRRFIAILSITKWSQPSRRAAGITQTGVLCLLMLPLSFRSLAQTHSTAAAAVPFGWLLAGSNPHNYEAGVDPQASYHGSPSAYLKAKQSTLEGFGTLMQDFSAGQYAGRRVRLRASMKTEEVADWAGLWMRVDKGSAVLGFDNMVDQPIKDTTGWRTYEVVLDVPQDATGIAFGILLNKSGSVWLNNVQLDGVGVDVPTTAKAPARLPEGPTNLHFER